MTFKQQWNRQCKKINSPAQSAIKLVIILFVLLMNFMTTTSVEALSSTFWQGKTGYQCGQTGTSRCPEAINFTVRLIVTAPSTVEPGEDYTVSATGNCLGDDYSGKVYVRGGVQGEANFSGTSAIFCPMGATPNSGSAGSITMTAPDTPGEYCYDYYVQGQKIAPPRATDYNIQRTKKDSFCITVETPAPPKPPAPSLSAGSCGTGQISASWSNVSGATGYDLQYRPTSGGSWKLLSNVSSPLDVTGLNPDTSYHFQLRAKNDTGSSAWSAYGKQTSPNICLPPKVTGLTATPQSCGTNRIRLTWNAASGATSYQVRIGSGSWTNVGNVTAYNVNGLTPGGNYSFRVRARNSAGEGAQSSLARATAPKVCAPGAVSGLSASPSSCGTGRINVSWNSVSGATSYQIQINGSWTDIGNNRSYSHTGLSAGSSHSYRIRARNGAGVGPQTSLVRATAPNICAPAQVTGLRAIPQSCGTNRIRLTWNAASGATSYQIRIGSGGWTNVGNVTAYNVNGLATNGSYSFRVRAVNGSGAGTQSALASATAPNICAPGAVSGLSASPSSCGTGRINVSWNSVSGATSYQIQINGSWTDIGNNRSYSHTGLSAGSSHSYRIRARNGAGVGPQTSLVRATAPNICAPGTPTVTASPAACGTGQINVSWNAVSGANRYEIRINGGAWRNVGNSTTYQHSGLAPNSANNYIVRSYNNSSGYGSNSNRPGAYAPPNCPVAGVCGNRATSYAYTDTNWAGGSSYCAAGTPSESPGFPAPGASAIWHCYGQYGGSDSGQCIASRGAYPGCGASAGGTFTNQPSSNLCTFGGATWSDTTANDGQFNWSCGPNACTANHQPDAPTNLSVNASGSCSSGQLYIDWNDVAGANSYSVYLADGTWVANTIGSNLSTFVGTPGQTYSFYVLANSPIGIQSPNSNVVSGTPTTCPPNASLLIRVNGGAWSASNQTIGAQDDIDIRWASSYAASCSASGGNGFGTGGATSGTDTSISSPSAGSSITFSINCDGATANVTVTSERANLAFESYQATPGTFNDATNRYDAMVVRFVARNTTRSAVPATPHRVRYDGRNYNGTTAGIAGNAEGGTNEVVLNNVPFGPFSANIILDQGNTVNEANESDNTATVTTTVPPPNPGLYINADRIQVRDDDVVSLEWGSTLTYPMNCTVEGPGVDIDPAALPGNTTTPGISAKSEYFLTCIEPTTATEFNSSVTVETVGSVEEI